MRRRYPLGMPDQVFQLAPAKVNLALSVGPPDPRAEGKHPICSWMVTVNLFDELEVVRTHPENMSLYSIDWHAEALSRSDIDWSISRDLAVRAHLLLEAHLGRKLPIRMKLRKRIPVGSGLGGGSSDAAAMLRACNELFDLGLDDLTLLDLAMRLGSDVGFALRGGSAIVEGFGERIEPAEHQERHLVLVLPPFACPTARVYREFDVLGGNGSVDAERVRKLAQGPFAEEGPFNDLTEPACAIAVDLAEIMLDVGDLAEAPAHLSGSGSALFVVCHDELHAEALAQAARNRLGYPAAAVRTWSGA